MTRCLDEVKRERHMENAVFYQDTIPVTTIRPTRNCTVFPGALSVELVKDEWTQLEIDRSLNYEDSSSE